jgi:hypothetical protein
MKVFKILNVFAVLFFLVQTVAAQVNPAISKEYSNDEIIRMVRKYKSAHSHDAIPNSALIQKFHADFPKAHDVEWEIADSIYEVEFEIKSRDYKAYYDTKGNLLMYIQEIRRTELPATVKNAAESKYPKYRFEDIDKIWRGTAVFYKVEMENKSSDMEVKLIIGEDGVILNETFDY